MDNKELRREALKNYKDTALVSWILGVSLALFSASIVATGLISNYLLFPLIVLLLFPCFFASIVSHLASKSNEQLTFSKHFSRSLAFFKNGNYRSFRLISSFFYSLLVYAVVFTFGMIVALIVFRNTHPDAFNELYQSFFASLYGEEESNFEELLMSYQDIILFYELLVTAPASLFALSFFIYRTSMNAMYVYAKRMLYRFESLLVATIHAFVFKVVGRNIRRDFLRLNWPMFVLFPIFSIGMGLVTYFFIRQTASSVITLGFVGGFLSLMFFLPFYFGNMEAIFKKYEMDYKKYTVQVINSLNERQERENIVIEDSEEDINSALEDLSNDDEDEEK